MTHRKACLYGWSALLVLVVSNVVYSARVLKIGAFSITVFGAICVALVSVGLGLLRWFPERSSLSRMGVPVAVAFFSLVIWLALTGIGRDRVVAIMAIQFPFTHVPAWMAYVPLAYALLAMVMAWLMVAAVRAVSLPTLLFWLGAVMVACGAVGQARALMDAGSSTRLDTGMGGASTLSVVFVLVIATMWGLALVGYRRGWSVALGCLATVELFLTESRAGLGMAAVLVVVLVGLTVRRRRDGARFSRLFAGCFAVGALILTVASFWFIPGLQRVLTPADPLRERNMATAISLVTEDWPTLVFGKGLGVVWPWYATDLGFVPTAPEGVWGWLELPGNTGGLVSNPHSLFLGVLVEGGLVGLALVVVLLGVVVWSAWRARRDALAGPILAAVCIVMLGFAFDYYLLKNFAVSWFWWLLVFAGLSLSRRGEPATRAAGSATIAQPN